MKEIIYKYFRDDKTLYFHSSDAHHDIAGDTFLYYKWDGERIELWFGGTNCDTVPIKVCSTPEDLEEIIKAIIY